MWKTTMIGRVVAAPELRSITGRDGSPLSAANFDLAVRHFNGETSFVNRISAVGRQAELIASTFRKGMKVYIEADMSTSRSELEDGSSRTYTNYRLTGFEYLEARRDDEEPTADSPGDAPF